MNTIQETLISVQQLCGKVVVVNKTAWNELSKGYGIVAPNVADTEQIFYTSKQIEELWPVKSWRRVQGGEDDVDSETHDENSSGEDDDLFGPTTKRKKRRLHFQASQDF